MLPIVMPVEDTHLARMWSVATQKGAGTSTQPWRTGDVQLSTRGEISHPLPTVTVCCPSQHTPNTFFHLIFLPQPTDKTALTVNMLRLCDPSIFLQW